MASKKITIACSSAQNCTLVEYMKRSWMNIVNTFFGQIRPRWPGGSGGAHHVWSDHGQDYHSECTVKPEGGSVIIWGCMSAKDVGEMTFIDGTMYPCKYTKILADKMIPSPQKLGRRGIFLHDNDPKHIAKKSF